MATVIGNVLQGIPLAQSRGDLLARQESAFGSSEQVAIVAERLQHLPGSHDVRSMLAEAALYEHPGAFLRPDILGSITSFAGRERYMALRERLHDQSEILESVHLGTIIHNLQGMDASTRLDRIERGTAWNRNIAERIERHLDRSTWETPEARLSEATLSRIAQTVRREDPPTERLDFSTGFAIGSNLQQLGQATRNPELIRIGSMVGSFFSLARGISAAPAVSSLGSLSLGALGGYVGIAISAIGLIMSFMGGDSSDGIEEALAQISAQIANLHRDTLRGFRMMHQLQLDASSAILRRQGRVEAGVQCQVLSELARALVMRPLDPIEYRIEGLRTLIEKIIVPTSRGVGLCDPFINGDCNPVIPLGMLDNQDSLSAHLDVVRQYDVGFLTAWLAKTLDTNNTNVYPNAVLFASSLEKIRVLGIELLNSEDRRCVTMRDLMRVSRDDLRRQTTSLLELLARWKQSSPILNGYKEHAERVASVYIETAFMTSRRRPVSFSIDSCVEHFKAEKVIYGSRNREITLDRLEFASGYNGDEFTYTVIEDMNQFAGVVVPWFFGIHNINRIQEDLKNLEVYKSLIYRLATKLPDADGTNMSYTYRIYPEFIGSGNRVPEAWFSDGQTHHIEFKLHVKLHVGTAETIYPIFNWCVMLPERTAPCAQTGTHLCHPDPRWRGIPQAPLQQTYALVTGRIDCRWSYTLLNNREIGPICERKLNALILNESPQLGDEDKLKLTKSIQLVEIHARLWNLLHHGDMKNIREPTVDDWTTQLLPPRVTSADLPQIFKVLRRESTMFLAQYSTSVSLLHRRLSLIKDWLDQETFS